MKPTGNVGALGRGFSALAAVAAVAALAWFMFPSGLAADDATISFSGGGGGGDGPGHNVDATALAHARYDADSIDSRAQAAVVEALMLYWAHGAAAFDMITPEENIRADVAYPFVLNATTLDTVANGAYPDLVGVVADTLAAADRPVDRILADLDRDGGAWAEYMASNPANGLVQLKRAWVYQYDGYVFGSGHYLPESSVKHVVEDSVRLFESKGRDAFDMITPAETLLTAELYPFVFDAATLKTVAHGAIPDRVGHVPYSILNTGDKSVDEIMADLERDGGTWVEYVFTNPATETKQLKRSWLYQYDDYIFSSGYYIQDSRAQSLVDEAVLLYAAHGEAAFDMITPEAADILAPQSSFVLNASNLEVVAHGVFPDMVGTTDRHIAAADRSLERIMDELRTQDGVWVWHMEQNPATRTDQLARTYVSLHDGYIFGSGYSMPDSRVQSLVDEAIYTYKQSGTGAFDIINSQVLNQLSIYPLVRNQTHMIAHGAEPESAGNPAWPIRAARADLGEAASGDSTFWQMVLVENHYTHAENVRRSWYTMHDGYFFLSSYAIVEGDVRSMVDYAMFVYESNKENDAWMDIITPEEPITTDDLYPFVIDASTWTRLADGVVPDRVGKPETILDTSERSVGDVLADLEANGGAWVTYTFHNPSTDTEQLKRTYLQLRDGLVFGSGYYIDDSHVQSIAHGNVLVYNSDGKDAAFAEINAVPEEPVLTYAFVADPATGTTVAQNVDPDLIGMPDWDIIASALSVDDLLEELYVKPGAWVSYTSTNPVTGAMEDKRTWLILHDGFVFGAGHH